MNDQATPKPAPPRRDTCSTCRWWDAADSIIVGKRQGFCHRNPPAVFPASQGSWASAHPPVHAEMWCGDHATRLELVT